MNIVQFLLCIVMCGLSLQVSSCKAKESLAEIQQRVKPSLLSMLESAKAQWGNPVFICIMKEELILELWVQPKNSDKFVLLKKYPVAGMSGELGPKTAEGDYQAPEGFYSTNKELLNPNSNYHLAFNIGYPNAYDQSLGRTGSFIMVHGSTGSIGCFAMTDAGIEEIYTMVEAALKAGQISVPIQIYPFAMTPQRLVKEKSSPHYKFWSALQPAWNYTEGNKKPYPVDKIKQAFSKN